MERLATPIYLVFRSMGIFQADKVIFYHPCNDSTEFTQTTDWTNTDALFPSGKVGAAAGGTDTPALGSETEYDSAGSDCWSRPRLCALDSTKFALLYEVNSGGVTFYARIGSVSGTAVTFGAAKQLLASAPTDRDFDVTRLDSTKCAIFYRNNGSSGRGQGEVLTVSGLDFTRGADVVFDSASIRNIQAAGLSATKAVVSYNDGGDSNKKNNRVATISGTDITFGAETTRFVNTGASDIADASHAWGMDGLDSTRVVVAWATDGGDPRPGLARIGTVSGDDITWGASSEFGGDNGGYTDVAALSSSKIMVVWRDRDSPYYGKARVGTVSGTDITWGAESDSSRSAPGGYLFHIAAMGSAKALVSYISLLDSSGRCKVATVSGTDITWSADLTFTAGDVGSEGQHGVAGLSSSVGVVAYTDGADSDHGTAKAVTAAAAGSLANGPTGFSSGSEAEFLAGDGAFYTAVAALSATKFAVAYKDGTDSSHGTAKIGTVSGADITFGAESEFLSANGAEYISAAALSSTKFVVVYADQSDSNHGTANIGTVSGTDITFGAGAEFTSAGGAGYSSIAVLSETKFVAIYRDDLDLHGAAKVGTVTGTAIAFGAEAEFLGVSQASWLATDALDATKFVVAYRDGSDSNHGTAKVGTVAGTDITFGAEKEFASAGAVIANSVAAISSTKFVVAYADGSDSYHGTAKVGTVSGTDITFGAEAEFESSGQANPVKIATVGTKVIVTWNAPTGAASAKIGTVSGTDITFGSADTFNTGGTDQMSVGAYGTTAVAAYQDGSASNYGKAVVYQDVADPYPTVVSETKVAFCGWFRKPSG